MSPAQSARDMRVYPKFLSEDLRALESFVLASCRLPGGHRSLPKCGREAHTKATVTAATTPPQAEAIPETKVRMSAQAC